MRWLLLGFRAHHFRFVDIEPTAEGYDLDALKGRLLAGALTEFATLAGSVNLAGVLFLTGSAVV